jgi:hypothetical protein
MVGGGVRTYRWYEPGVGLDLNPQTGHREEWEGVDNYSISLRNRREP